jgi:hypothetical protein
MPARQNDGHLSHSHSVETKLAKGVEYSFATNTHTHSVTTVCRVGETRGKTRFGTTIDITSSHSTVIPVRTL